MATTLTAEEQAAIEKVVMLVDAGSQEYSWDHDDVKDIIETIRKAKVKMEISHRGIAIRFDTASRRVHIIKIGGSVPETKPEPKIATPTAKKPEPKAKPGIPAFAPHKFHNPPFHNDIVRAISDPAGLVVCGVGPTGSGKSSHMAVVAEELGMEFFQINCRRDMEASGFIGEKTIEPDAETKASVVKFQYGPVVRAMRCGLDADGNETGKPGLLVLDEFPTLPSWLGMGLNNLLETRYPRRRLCIPENGGEVVYAHSGFRIVLLGNTIGRGVTMESSEYTGQGDALDISTLDRVSVVFNYGYSKKAEEKLLIEKIGDDEIVNKMVKFRDSLRQARRDQGIRTPLSTRLLVQIADNYRVFGGDLGKALLYTMVNKTMPQEKAVYMEQVMVHFGIRLEKIAELAGMDYDF
jgi:hypothetical protein